MILYDTDNCTVRTFRIQLCTRAPTLAVSVSSINVASAQPQRSGKNVFAMRVPSVFQRWSDADTFAWVPLCFRFRLQNCRAFWHFGLLIVSGYRYFGPPDALMLAISRTLKHLSSPVLHLCSDRCDRCDCRQPGMKTPSIEPNGLGLCGHVLHAIHWVFVKPAVYHLHLPGDEEF